MSDTGTTIGQTGEAMRRREGQNPILRQIWRHWEALRSGRIAPMRRELDPTAIAAALENAFILEQAGPGLTRFRLAGLGLCDLMGMELRGMPADSLIHDDARLRYAEAVDRVFASGEIVEMRLVPRGGAPDAAAELLILPMRDDFGRLNRALGALVANPQALVRTPCRFDIVDVAHTRVVTMATDRAEAPHPGLAEAPARFDGPDEIRTPRKLRLVALGGRRIDADPTESDG